jgi:hypothetical protein
VVTTNIVELGLLNERPDLGLLKMFNFVLVGGSKVSAHAAVVAGDNDTALSSGLSIVDAVFGVDTSLLAGLLKDLSVLVLADAADVQSRVLGQNVLREMDQQIEVITKVKLES